MAFHATAPAGAWINDPNGLIRRESGWRLFAQYREAPAFAGATSWAAFDSTDLIRWRFAGVAIPATDDAWAYSGCLVRSGAFVDAVLTRHAPGPPARQAQVRWRAGENASNFRFVGPLVGLPCDRADFRDPYLFDWRGRTWMAVAEPGAWADADRPASRLRFYRQSSNGRWEEVGCFGPAMPAHLLWEVPVLIPLRALDAAAPEDGFALILSIVDRSKDQALCSARYWLGAFDGARFVPEAGWPAAGRLLDQGPDFYAATAVEAADGGGGRTLVAWASSWQTARAMPWPGFAGGPITLPRRLALCGGRLCQEPEPLLRAAFTQAAGAVPTAGLADAKITDGFELRVAGDGCQLLVACDAGRLRVERTGPDWLDWQSVDAHAVERTDSLRLMLFVDGPLIELFLLPGGAAVTAALPSGGRPFEVSLTSGGRRAALRWTTLP